MLPGLKQLVRGCAATSAATFTTAPTPVSARAPQHVDVVYHVNRAIQIAEWSGISIQPTVEIGFASFGTVNNATLASARSGGAKS